MKITVVTPRYAISGVPLAQTKFARALGGAGHEVELIIGRADAGLELPKLPNVKVSVLDLPNVRAMFLPLWRYFRSAKPDVVFSAEDHLNTIVLLAAIASGSRAKISGSSRVTPFDTYSNKIFSKRWILKQLATATSWRAQALTCVSEDMVAQYQKVFRSPRHVCVYNIIVNSEADKLIAEPVTHPWLTQNTGIPVITAAGSLQPWKGFGNLIQAIGVLSKRRKLRLIILGEGPLRTELEALVKSLDLESMVDLPGHVSNPLKYFAHSDVFALSSTVEGLPNVLVEAMMAGCTPVSTDCPTGPREVLQDGRYGYLVPVNDPSAMALAIEKALDAPIPRAKLMEALIPFKEDVILARHFEILGISNTNLYESA